MGARPNLVPRPKRTSDSPSLDHTPGEVEARPDNFSRNGSALSLPATPLDMQRNPRKAKPNPTVEKRTYLQAARRESGTSVLMISGAAASVVASRAIQLRIRWLDIITRLAAERKSKHRAEKRRMPVSKAGVLFTRLRT